MTRAVRVCVYERQVRIVDGRWTIADPDSPTPTLTTPDAANAHKQPDALTAASAPPAATPWAFSHRDVFDLIGKHKYDHTLPDLLTALAGPQAGGACVRFWGGVIVVVDGRAC